MCDLLTKSICSLIFGLISFGMLCGAISSSTIWYTDVETAVGISPQNNNPTALSLSWQASLSQLCLQSGSFYNTGNGQVSITPTCWPFASSPVTQNPNNDATISFLFSNYLTEAGNGLNMLQKSASYTTAALGIAIACSLIFTGCISFIYFFQNRYPVAQVLCGFKCVGFFFWLSTMIAFLIYAGGIVKASSDFDVTLPGANGPTALINAPGMSHTLGFGIAVGAHGLAFIACCCGLLVMPSEIISRVDPDAVQDASSRNLVNGLPNIAVTINAPPGVVGAASALAGATVTDPNASFFVPSKSNPRAAGQGGFAQQNPAMQPRPPTQPRSFPGNGGGGRSPSQQYHSTFYAQSPPAGGGAGEGRGSPYR